MNSNDQDTRFDPGSPEERRWMQQEKARRGDADADVADLRIARALRHAPPVGLAPDFAAQVAALAGSRPVASIALEQWLLRTLVTIFALSALVMLAWFGRGAVAALAALLPGGVDALGWSVVAVVCLLCNWGFGVLRDFAAAGRHVAA